MRKRILLSGLLLILILSACAQSSTEDAQQISVATLEITPQPTPTTGAQCHPQVPQPTPNPTVQAILPPVSDRDWSKGSQEAYVTLIEYGDYQSPFSAAFFPELAKLEADFGDDLQIAYRHYPHDENDKSFHAHFG